MFRQPCCPAELRFRIVVLIRYLLHRSVLGLPHSLGQRHAILGRLVEKAGVEARLAWELWSNRAER